MADPRSVREALVAELLGDVDVILTRFEALVPAVADAEKRVLDSVAVLEGAGDRYKMVVTAFSEQAKSELGEFLDRKTQQVTAQTLEEHRAAIQGAAREAFRSEASDKATALGIALGEAAREFRRSRWDRFMDHAFTALLASLVTSGLVYGITRIH
jgi:hypothetical protein